MKRNYTEFYTRITRGVAGNDRRTKALITSNRILTYLFYIAYPLLLIWIFIFRKNFFWKALLVPAVSFLILSVFRRLINRKRPYESWPIHALIHKDTRGKSMPSRHLFSSAVIAMVFLYVNPLAGIIALILSGLDGVIRVIGGVHYPTDVIAGFACGIIAGCFLWL